MSTSQDFVDFIVNQMKDAGTITYRKMFGEYAIYNENKVVALVCDDVKPTKGGRRFIGEVVEAPAYPGAKMSFLIDEKIEDSIWLSALIRITTHELPRLKK